MAQLNTPVPTPSADQINATQLIANLLALAGYGQPTREFIIDTLELIAAALDVVNPDDEERATRADDLASYFHHWANTVSEDVDTLPAGGAEVAEPVVSGETHAFVPLTAIHALHAAADQTRYGVFGLEVLRNAAEQLPTIAIRPIRIAVAIEGGIAQTGAVESQLPVDLMVVDYDVKDETDPNARAIRQDNGETTRAWVYAIGLGAPRINLADVFDAAREQG